MELGVVFRLACFYFSSQKQNRKNARRFCTVGSRWCESPLDFCESTYSYVPDTLSQFYAETVRCRPQNLLTFVTLLNWSYNTFCFYSSMPSPLRKHPKHKGGLQMIPVKKSTAACCKSCGISALSVVMFQNNVLVM